MIKAFLFIITLLAICSITSQDSTRCGNTGVSCSYGFTCCSCRPGQNPTFTCRYPPLNWYCWDNLNINQTIGGRYNDLRPLVCPGDGLTPCPYGWVIDRTTYTGCRFVFN